MTKHLVLEDRAHARLSLYKTLYHHKNFSQAVNHLLERTEKELLEKVEGNGKDS